MVVVVAQVLLMTYVIMPDWVMGPSTCAAI
jgi:hypothetical protein